jgi:lipopolysaccharide biosynthesis protein
MTVSSVGVRAIAFYLPQFHPIPENDRWWGKGFTEWTNVAKAKPLFKGHYQPHIPADLGFYDLRLAETRQAQADLAREYGINAFCYYHYWFGGRRLLERPFSEVLKLGKPNFPFCLCWANENWTRQWDGQQHEVLVPQEYSVDDYRAHLRYLVPTFEDRRYVRVDGKPVFLIYRASNLPDPKRAVEVWREEATKCGLPGLYLCNVESLGKDQALGPAGGFDASVEFAPDWRCLITVRRYSRVRKWLRKVGLASRAYGEHTIMTYDEMVERMQNKPEPPYLRYPCVTPSWDNSARRRSGSIILHGASPEKYQSWFEHVLREFLPPSAQENFVFINAWNEWAEGNHLEPCLKWGRAYLEATRRALAIHHGR